MINPNNRQSTMFDIHKTQTHCNVYTDTRQMKLCNNNYTNWYDVNNRRYKRFRTVNVQLTTAYVVSITITLFKTNCVIEYTERTIFHFLFSAFCVIKTNILLVMYRRFRAMPNIK